MVSKGTGAAGPDKADIGARLRSAPCRVRAGRERGARRPSAGTLGAVSRAGHRTDAIVVRVVEFGDTSQIVHLATPARGLVAALAKGAHAPKGAFQGGLTFGVLGEADLLPRPRAELELLRSFRVTDGLRGLHEHVDRFTAGSYVLGLLRELERPALPAPALFAAAVTALKAISTSAPDHAPLWVAVFEARALAAAGHRPHLGTCVGCGGELDRNAVFAPAVGGTAHRRCATAGPTRPLAPGDLRALARFYTARLPELLGEPPTVEEVRVVRAIHDLFLPYVLDREPRGLRAIPGR